jgi:hypothetical protein
LTNAYFQVRLFNCKGREVSKIKKNSLLLILAAFVVIMGSYLIISSQSLPKTVEPEDGVNEELVEDTEVTPETDDQLAEFSPEEVDIKEDLITAVKEGVAAKHGTSPENYEVTIGLMAGNYARGGIKEVESGQAGGAGWYAARVDREWELVWDGNGTISCSDLKDYPEFPAQLIPECYDEDTGEMVAR